MAGRYPDELISEVVAANDIVDTVSRYVRLKRSGRSLMGCCPFHKEKTPSFHVSPDKQLYHCFGCGAGGTVLQFIMTAEGLDFPDALKLLADRAGIRLPEAGAGESEEKYRHKQTLYSLNKEAARYFRDCLFSEAGAAARDYLTRRALTSQTVAAFGIGFAPDGWQGLLDHLTAKGFTAADAVEVGLCVRSEKGRIYDRFRGRVMFPIFDVRSNLIGFGGRILEGEGAKYMNSPESVIYDKGRHLFALNRAKKAAKGSYILVEGYMDVITLHQAGIQTAVAGCGTALTEAQARLLGKNGATVYLCYDMDEAGQKACTRAAELFRPLDCRLRVIAVPKGKDPDEFVRNFGGEAFSALLSKAQTVTEYRLQALERGYNLSEVSQKIEYISEAAKLLAAVDSEMEREAYLKSVSRRTGISEDAIFAEVRKQRGRLQRSEAAKDLRQQLRETPAATATGSARRTNAEARLLSVLLSDRAAYQKLGDAVEKLLSVPLHREIFEKMAQAYSAGGAIYAADLLRAFPGREDAVSAVLLSETAAEDALGAAADYKRVIEEEERKAQIEQAVKDGDTARLSELLSQK